MAQVSNREQLIDGAVTCLQTKGYARTTARDIAAASGANLASIGYHFGSKEALLNAALIRILEERNRFVGAIAFSSDQATPLERLTATFAAVHAIFENFRPVLVAFVEAMAQAERSSELRSQMAAHYGVARQGIAALLRAGLGDAAGRLEKDPGIMASLLLAMLDGLVFQWLLEPGDVPSGEELVEALAEWMNLALEQETASRQSAARAKSPHRRGGAESRRGRPKARPR
jgi:AcrR family transcriptional regulator